MMVMSTLNVNNVVLNTLLIKNKIFNKINNESMVSNRNVFLFLTAMYYRFTEDTA